MDRTPQESGVEKRVCQPHILPHTVKPISDELMELVADTRSGTPSERHRIIHTRREMGELFFSNLLYALVGLRKPDDEAEEYWNAIVEHKLHLEHELGRDTGLRVAAMDYLENIAGEKPDLQIVDKEVFVTTARLAITDGLTDLYNHRYLQDALHMELSNALTHDEPLSLIIFDIDYFKEYNDTNGHIAGDVALRQVASIIRETVGTDGMCARYGGEEFAVILPRCGKKRAGELADKIRQATEQHLFPNAFVLPFGKLTLSAGVAEFPLDATQRRGLISYADLALYQAKRDGRNRICLFAPDRRYNSRFWVPLPVQIALCGLEDVTFSGVTINLAFGGVLCACEHSVPRGAEAVLHLPEVAGMSLGPMRCAALRSHQSDETHWEVAFRFLDMTQELQKQVALYIRHADRGEKHEHAKA